MQDPIQSAFHWSDATIWPVLFSLDNDILGLPKNVASLAPTF
jgi:hypothetical protein